MSEVGARNKNILSRLRRFFYGEDIISTEEALHRLRAMHAQDEQEKRDLLESVRLLEKVHENQRKGGVMHHNLLQFRRPTDDTDAIVTRAWACFAEGLDMLRELYRLRRDEGREVQHIYEMQEQAKDLIHGVDAVRSER